MKKPAVMTLAAARKMLDAIYASKDQQTIDTLSITMKLFHKRLRLEGISRG